MYEKTNVTILKNAIEIYFKLYNLIKSHRKWFSYLEDNQTFLTLYGLPKINIIPIKPIMIEFVYLLMKLLEPSEKYIRHH